MGALGSLYTECIIIVDVFMLSFLGVTTAKRECTFRRRYTMLSLAALPKSCRHHDTLSSNHLGAEVGVLRLGLWVRGIGKPRVLFSLINFSVTLDICFKVGVRGIIIIDFCFPAAATSTSMWSRWDHRKSIQAPYCREPIMHYTVVHTMTNALCQHLCFFAFPALYLLP